MLQRLYHKLDKIAKRVHHEIANSVRVCSNTKTNIRSKTMQNIVITTDLNLEEEAKVIKSLESKIAELKELKDERIAKIKEVMNKANVLELQAGSHTFKLTEITRNNIDTKTLKTKYSELYKALLKVSTYFKFDIL